MPKSIEKSELPLVLRTRHQWLRWRGLLIAGILGLTATLAAIWMVRGSAIATQLVPWLAEIWIGGLALTLLVALVAYFSASRSLLSTAQKLDGQFAAKGRLEAVALLKDSATPLARAQREETLRYLERQAQARPVRGVPWLTGCLVLLMLAHLLTLAIWFAPHSTKSAAWTAWTKNLIHLANPTQPPAPTPNAPKPAIAWHTPDPVTQANPLEQVPAEATVTSAAPLQNLTLQVSVNGELRQSVPIPADQYAQPGEHEVKVTIPLDALQAKPFDVVSYKLTAQDSTSEKSPETASPTQFVQVRPFRNPETPTGAPAATAISNAAEQLDQLQQAQLQALSENMQLAQSESSPTDPARQKEDASVAADQSALAARTEQVAKALADQHAPNDTLDHLHQAGPLMDDSGKKISAAQNEAAMASQEKAVSQIAAAEQALQSANQTAAQPAQPPSSDPNNPFNDQPKHDLAPRQQSLIAQLETLAKNQTALAQDIGKNLDDSTSKPQVDAATTLPAPAPPIPLPDQNPAPNSAPPPQAPNANQTAANAPTPPASATPPPNAPANSATTPPAPANATPAAPNVTPSPTPAPPPIDPFSPDANKGSFAERQDRVLHGIATLQSADKADLESENQPLATAQKEATDSLHQLSAEQENAAREPAATAAVDLQQTVNAMNEAGEAQTRQALAETQQKLNDLASQLRGLAQNHPANAAQSLMTAATEVHDVQQGLQSVADHQENEGSATGATQLNQLAQSLQDQKTAPELAAMSKNGLDPGRAAAQADNLEHLAQQAAADMTPAQPSAQDFDGLANALQRTETNLDHLAQQAGQSTSPSSDSGTAPNSQAGQQSPSQPNGQNGAGNNPNSNTQTIGASPGQQSSGQNPSTASTPPGQPPGSTGSGQPSSQGQPNSPPSDAALSQAYHEAFQDLKNQTQQLAKVVPGADAAAVQDVIARYDKDTSYRAVTPKDVVKFHADLQQPLERAIVDVQGLQQHAQRGEVVNAPDLDETPAAYRPAVSQYFQDVSRDYHTSPTPDNSKQ
jgi:hypothetical protein